MKITESLITNTTLTELNLSRDENEKSWTNLVFLLLNVFHKQTTKSVIKPKRHWASRPTSQTFPFLIGCNSFFLSSYLGYAFSTNSLASCFFPSSIHTGFLLLFTFFFILFVLDDVKIKQYPNDESHGQEFCP